LLFSLDDVISVTKITTFKLFPYVTVEYSTSIALLIAGLLISQYWYSYQ